ncbi:MAG: hypothetical protein JO037_09190 [Actinobacteria bacterium]|nr:hypothetical protein [Actinomycetota bacterium]
MTSPALTRPQAEAAVKAAVDERGAIQANLLELDASFGKRLLDGAELTGETATRWDAAAATLATLWQVYSAYSAVIDQAAGAVTRRPGARELATITALLTGPSVQLAPGPAPLAGRDLADTGREELTLAAAIARMRAAFTAVAEVVSAAEQVWNEIAGRLDAAGAELARVTPLAASLGDEAVTADLAATAGTLAGLRATLNSDPLALWRAGASPVVDVSDADRLRERANAAAARVDALVRLRDDARRRVAEVKTAAATARSAREDAVAAWQRAAARIAAPALPPEPEDLAGLSARLAALDPLLAGGRWTRLESELDLLTRALAAETAKFREAERTVVTLIARRDELRGLLGAYKAKAARLGAAEDAGLADRYDRARDLLWTAPCDLDAAAAAVTGYQQAVLGLT